MKYCFRVLFSRTAVMAGLTYLYLSKLNDQSAAVPVLDLTWV